MCKWSKWGDTRIDPCMRTFIANLKSMIGDSYEIVACCCGHGKYPMSIVLKMEKNLPFIKEDIIFDLVSDEPIPRKRRFYVRDKKGYYYIPEAVKHDKKV